MRDLFYIRFIAFHILFSLSFLIQAQMISHETDADTTYTLIGDTIFTNKNFKIFPGQKLLVGEGAGERGWYNSITFRSGASWPLLLFEKMETENNIEYQFDSQIRVKDKVKEYLPAGDTLFVRKIKKYGKKGFYWYQVLLSQKPGFLSLNFRCDLINAIKSKEILLLKD